MDAIGIQLLKEGLVSEGELELALEPQKREGGRIGTNLVQLGILTDETLQKFLKRRPAAPLTIEETGLEISFITDLVMKHILFMNEFKISDLVRNIKLSSVIVDKALQTLKENRLIEVREGDGYATTSYRFTMTEAGRKHGQELLALNRYAGPAPVTLDAYRRLVEQQSIKNILVSKESVKKAFSHLILSESLLERLGPAISSGRAIFVYGPPGNGKTAIAETIGAMLPETVYIPHAILTGGQIIALYDPEIHIPVAGDATSEEIDPRWVEIKRPLVTTGGELNLGMLDLSFNPISKYYEAAIQMKANNGIFIIDDFGRQQCDPKNLLNRWIVPLERRMDFVTLHTGLQVSVPFDILVVFSTNIEPKELVDEAFLRRIRHKIKIDHPTQKEYEEIFKRVCAAKEVPFDKESFEYLIAHYYKRLKVNFNACHPRDLLDHIVDNAHYQTTASRMTKDGIDYAWQSYFVDM